MGGQPQATKTTTSPWKEQQPYLLSGFEQAKTLSQQPKEWYPFATTVPFSRETSQALDMAGQRALAGSDLTRAAQSEIGKTIGGAYLDPTTNPAFQKAAQGIQAQVGGMYSGAGRYGSGAMANQANEALSNLAASTYAGERANQLNAAQMAPALAQSDYFDTGQLANVGAVREGQAAKELAANVQKFDFGQNEADQRLNQYLQRVQGNYGGVTVNNPGGKGGSPILQGLGTAAQVAGGAGSLITALSDRRAKTDIRQVGTTFGGLPIYTFRYKWGGPVQMGVMAQEVERVKPEAVGAMAGYKTVDYAQIE